MNFKKVHPDFGIEINDIKINKANKKEIDEILNLFEEYSLIVLKDQKGVIKSVLGLFNKTNSYIRANKNKILLQSTFYDIYENNLLINPLQTKISLRYLRKICLENFKFSFQRLLTIFELTNGLIIISFPKSTPDNLSTNLSYNNKSLSTDLLTTVNFNKSLKLHLYTKTLVLLEPENN